MTLTKFEQLKAYWWKGDARKVRMQLRNFQRLVTQNEQTALALRLLAVPRPALQVADRVQK